MFPGALGAGGFQDVEGVGQGVGDVFGRFLDVAAAPVQRDSGQFDHGVESDARGDGDPAHLDDVPVGAGGEVVQEPRGAQLVRPVRSLTRV